MGGKCGNKKTPMQNALGLGVDQSESPVGCGHAA